MDLVKEIREVKNQLAYAKDTGFFFGAGTSCALGVPNIAILTRSVREKLEGKLATNYDAISADLATRIPAEQTVNIEDILNQVRRIRDITGNQNNKNYLNVTGKDAQELDKEICKLIYSLIKEKESCSDFTITKKFFSWLNVVNHECSKEVFTTNYDLILEKALEACQIPYFDGFVGAYEPFFYSEGVDRLHKKNELTSNWIRLWKIHGSLSWFWKDTDTQSVVRVGKFDGTEPNENELVIYPSKEKYDSSRKQPFISYFDRLKNFLLNGELLFIFSGYSFSDQHINEIILNCLRQNHRLHCIVFCFQDSDVERLNNLLGPSCMNMSVFGPKKGIVKGTMDEWQFDKNTTPASEQFEMYWDDAEKKCSLGDFSMLVEFLAQSSGNATFKGVAQ